MTIFLPFSPYQYARNAECDGKCDDEQRWTNIMKLFMYIQSGLQQLGLWWQQDEKDTQTSRKPKTKG